MQPISSLFTYFAITLLLAIYASISLAAPILDSSGTAEIKEQNTNVKEESSIENSKLPLLSTGTQLKIVNRSNNAEKLKRGLTNFINQLNPAPFFVPTQPQQQQSTKALASSASQSSAEPVAIVNEDPTAEALIKRPNRIGQTRPIGGPLRWG